MVAVGEGRKGGVGGRVLKCMKDLVDACEDEVIRRREAHVHFGGEPRQRIANARGASSLHP